MKKDRLIKKAKTQSLTVGSSGAKSGETAKKKGKTVMKRIKHKY